MANPLNQKLHNLDFTCLYSTVKNISGRSMKFGFLPPHGRELDADEEFTIFGDVKAAVATLRGGERAGARRDIQAFEDAMDEGYLELIQTPSPILQDQTTEDSKMITLDNGTLGVADPCWFASESE